MTDIVPVDEIKSRYDKTSNLRNRIIDMLTEDEQKLNLTISDKDSASLLMKLIDGEDRQTIARQKNATDEKIANVVGHSLSDIADAVIQGMGGIAGIRGAPDASRAPTESVQVAVEVVPGENHQGVDENLSYATLVEQAEKK